MLGCIEIQYENAIQNKQWKSFHRRLSNISDIISFSANDDNSEKK